MTSCVMLSAAASLVLSMHTCFSIYIVNTFSLVSDSAKGSIHTYACMIRLSAPHMPQGSRGRMGNECKREREDLEMNH
jgi:hypothetical protein